MSFISKAKREFNLSSPNISRKDLEILKKSITPSQLLTIVAMKSRSESRKKK